MIRGFGKLIISNEELEGVILMLFKRSYIILNKIFFERFSYSKHSVNTDMANPIKILLKTPTWLTIILGSFLLIWQTYQGELSQEIQVAFFGALILLTGIPHGALDHLIQKATDNQQNRVYNFKGFMLKYLLIMGLYGLSWYFFSGISFIIFLIISAWHFGETDLENAPQNAQIWSFTRLLYGFYILAFILLTHTQEVSPILERMINPQSKTMAIWEFIQRNVKQILYLLGLSLSTIFIVAQSESFINFDKIRLLRLGLILFISIYLPLLPAFALYFGGWHALCAFDTIHGYLQKDHPSLTFKSVYLKALPFTIVALCFLLLFLWYCQQYTKSYNPFPILFIFISLITLPHLVISHQMNNAK
jgi:beta-carotene 15,15'-dioxygenase